MKRLLLLYLVCILTCTSFAQLIYPQRTSLPTMYINTENKRPIDSKEVYVTGKTTIVSQDETECITDSVINIRGRGNSTWGMAKKPYRIKFNKKTRLLNQSAELKNWVLLANYADKSLMRNAVAFEISKYLGMDFTPCARFVDVVVNDVYVGNYMLTDQVEVNENRVPVTEQLPTNVAEPEITGGYLIELDGFAASEPVWFQTNKGVKVTVKSPKNDEINTQQYDYITNYTRGFENLLFSSNYTDPESGYRAKVDEKSLIDWYIACELTGNSDAFWSIYLYKEREIDKFNFGPLWDFDIAFNNDDRLGDATRKLMRQYAHDPKTWIQRIWTDKWFRHAVNVRWKELLESGIEQHLKDYIDNVAEEIDQSQIQNFTKWTNLNYRVYREYKLFQTYKEGVEYLKQYLTSRIAFLTTSFDLEDNIGNEPEPFVADDYYYYIMNIRTNNVIDITEQSQNENALLMLWNPIDELESQQWYMEPVGNDALMIISRLSGLAIQGNGRGNNLIQVTPDYSNKAQLWRITGVSKGIYGIINVQSGYSINNNAGSFENGNKVIEWDQRITESQNQQWYIQKTDRITTRMEQQSVDLDISGYYRGGYFVFSPLPKTLNKPVNIELYSSKGQLLIKKHLIGNTIDVNNLANGMYIVRVHTNIGVTSLKFIKK